MEGTRYKWWGKGVVCSTLKCDPDANLKTEVNLGRKSPISSLSWAKWDWYVVISAHNSALWAFVNGNIGSKNISERNQSDVINACPGCYTMNKWNFISAEWYWHIYAHFVFKLSNFLNTFTQHTYGMVLALIKVFHGNHTQVHPIFFSICSQNFSLIISSCKCCTSHFVLLNTLLPPLKWGQITREYRRLSGEDSKRHHLCSFLTPCMPIIWSN